MRELSIRSLAPALFAGLLALNSATSWAAVGRTSTSFNVSDSGEAQYTVPIFAPPGTNGLSPSLAFTYGHRASGPLMGAGWGVSGIGSISRCPKTWVQDGLSREVSLDALDRFCLNGNQLKAFSGTYGLDGAEYRTEIETYARIISKGSAGIGPAWFSMEGTDGLIYEYGNTTDSRIESVGTSTARAWMLNRIRDRSGNQINFVYNEDTTNGSVNIASVHYTANPSQGISAAYAITFTYETQPLGEVESAYLGGSKIKDVKRMTRADVTYSGALVRRYKLAYEASLSSAGRSRLASITECAGSTEADCLAPTTFTYQNGTVGLGSFTAAPTTASTVYPIDYNGDGRTDLVFASGGTWWVARANGSGYAAAVNTGVASPSSGQIQRIDYNADGLEDLLVTNGTSTWWVVQGTPTGLAAAINTGIAAVTDTVRALDVNGDGLEDLVWADTAASLIRYRPRVWGSTFGAVTTLYAPPGGFISTQISYSFAVSEFRQKDQRPDFNGDGHEDLLFRVRYEIDPGMYIYNWIAVFSNSAGGASSLISSSSNITSVLTPDLNGDGCSDLAYVRSPTTPLNYQWYYRFSTCKSFTSEVAAGLALGTRNYLAAVVLDWDEDGLQDILVPNNSTLQWNVLRSNGEALSNSYLTTSLTVGSTAYVGDANGDGMTDLIVQQGAGMNWGFVPRSGVRHDLLQTATDGYGNAATFSYAPLSNYGSYSKGSGAVFPAQDYAGPLYVVSNVQAPNGIGGSYTLSPYYQAARVNLQGRGFLGFAYRSWIDSRNNTAQRYSHRQDFPYIGAVYDFRRTQEPSATVMVQDQTTYSAITYGASYEARYFPYASQVVHSEREVGGSYNGALVRSSTTTNLYESNYGTLYDQTVVTTEPASGANGIRAGTSWTSRTYLPTAQLTSDSTSWCRGRPGEVQQIQSHGAYGGGAITRTRQINWDTTACRPTSLIA